MGKTFKNTKEMEDVLEKVLLTAVRDVSEEMETKIHDEIIDMGIGSSSDWYQSTGEFANAWRQLQCARTGDADYEGGIYYEPNRIRTHNQELGQHTSISPIWQNTYKIDEILPYMIFNGTDGFWTIEGRDAWTKFINSMDKSFAKIMRKSFAKHGIKLNTKENYRM